MSVRQSGRIKLQAGDEIIICSDGITGDFPQDVLDDNEIIRAMQSSTDPQETARALVRISRKKDDKAVLVLK
jgi:serine/threonine protein phosphatase PrpC